MTHEETSTQTQKETVLWGRFVQKMFSFDDFCFSMNTYFVFPLTKLKVILFPCISVYQHSHKHLIVSWLLGQFIILIVCKCRTINGEKIREICIVGYISSITEMSLPWE